MYTNMSECKGLKWTCRQSMARFCIHTTAKIILDTYESYR